MLPNQWPSTPLFQPEQSNEYFLHYRRSGRGHRGRRLSWSASLKDFFANGLLPAWVSASNSHCCQSGRSPERNHHFPCTYLVPPFQCRHSSAAQSELFATESESDAAKNQQMRGAFKRPPQRPCRCVRARPVWNDNVHLCSHVAVASPPS
jgi:hypothetical protein